MNVSEIVLQELEQITGTDEVRADLDLALFTEKVLDSFGSVELMVALSSAFKLELTPGKITREQWATPRKIIQYIDEQIKG
jgi:D-alanine--poly(phosphoribitol) ligase subunit 2